MTGVDEQILSARVVLAWLAEPGSRALHQLVARHGPVEALRLLASGSLTGHLAEAAAARLGGREPTRLADQLREHSRRIGAEIIVPESKLWPAALDDLARLGSGCTDRIDTETLPPHALWLRGPLPIDEAVNRCVAIVGARASTSYGDHVASDLAHGLADRGWTIISGGAFGIDASAHKGALAADGATIAVMACGVDRFYPAGNSALLERITHQGLIISEWPPGAAPHRVRFLIRNRVIAALARGTIMVEASARSGARQTLRRARQLGRRAMAVPGPITSDMSVGCHEELRRDGDDRVRLVTTVPQVLEEIGAVGDDLAPRATGPSRAHDSLSMLEQHLVDATPHGGAGVEQIAAAAGVPVLYAVAALPVLEMRGHVQREPDGTYRLRPGS